MYKLLFLHAPYKFSPKCWLLSECYYLIIFRSLQIEFNIDFNLRCLCVSENLCQELSSVWSSQLLVFFYPKTDINYRMSFLWNPMLLYLDLSHRRSQNYLIWWYMTMQWFDNQLALTSFWLHVETRLIFMRLISQPKKRKKEKKMIITKESTMRLGC